MPRRTGHKYSIVEVFEDEDGNIFEYRPKRRCCYNVQFAFEESSSRKSTGWKRHKGKCQWMHNLRSNVRFTANELSYKYPYADTFTETPELSEEEYIEMDFSSDSFQWEI